MAVETLAPRDVQSTLNYFLPLDAHPPYNYVYPEPGVQKTNVGEEPHPVIIHDAREQGDELGLDVTGFQFVNYPSVEKDFVDQEQIKTVYYAECEEILKKYTGAKRIFIFNHTIRRSSIDPSGVRVPLQRVHVDQAFAAVADRVKDIFGDEAERLLKGRYRLINVWRPIANTVAHNPLALADYRSVNTDRDFVVTRHVDARREGATFNVKYNPGHKWHYLSDQTPDEVTLIKIFDSDISKARCAPHSAFCDSTSPVDAPRRQSIEIRALVFDIE